MRHSACQPQFRPRWRGRGKARSWHGVSSRELYHFCRGLCWLSRQISVAAKVSVVRREQIRVLNQNRRGLSTFQPFNFSTSSAQPFNFSTCLTAAQTAAQSAAEITVRTKSNCRGAYPRTKTSLYSKTYTEGSDPFDPRRRSTSIRTRCTCRRLARGGAFISASTLHQSICQF